MHFSVLNGVVQTPESQQVSGDFVADVGGGGGRHVPAAGQHQGPEGNDEAAEPVPAARGSAPHSSAAEEAAATGGQRKPGVQTPGRVLACHGFRRKHGRFFIRALHRKTGVCLCAVYV